MRPALLLLALVVAAPAVAQPCPGDCNGDGVVRVDEMIVGVRIALGEGVVADCPAFDGNGDGTVAIDELIRAVASTLNGCPATPTPSPSETPSPSPTATATATDTETATATPTIPPVAGAWVEDPLTVADSTCAEIFTSAFADELASRGPCSQQVEVTGEASVRVTDCSNQVVDGTLDRDGTMHLAFPPSDDTVSLCTVTLTVSSVIAAGADPVTADYTFAFVFGGAACQLDDCTIDAGAAWTRVQ
ncbi:MAG TPA: hypothetical protein VL049_06630 [Candidatus Dormibacteraeota bacterium]|nr:hypothetical protein [Candidatus Dormibacteraeota bacterium]